MKYPVTPIRGLTLKQMLKDLEAKRSGKAGTFGWRGKAKDYPGAANIKRGLVKKGKPKLKIV
tara:strand:+ start:503 stop:688 length:186 start_codon:yes stop_codon:yes gene_type:complete